MQFNARNRKNAGRTLFRKEETGSTYCGAFARRAAFGLNPHVRAAQRPVYAALATLCNKTSDQQHWTLLKPIMTTSLLAACGSNSRFGKPSANTYNCTHDHGRSMSGECHHI